MNTSEVIRVELPGGIIQYSRNGILHRDDGGPAFERPTGEKTWIVDGRAHRLDGPALMHTKSQEYWVEGLKHRVDGPAVVYYDPATPDEWWYRGKRLSDGVVDTLLRLLPTSGLSMEELMSLAVSLRIDDDQVGKVLERAIKHITH